MVTISEFATLPGKLKIGTPGTSFSSISQSDSFDCVTESGVSSVQKPIMELSGRKAGIVCNVDSVEVTIEVSNTNGRVIIEVIRIVSNNGRRNVIELAAITVTESKSQAVVNTCCVDPLE